MSEVSEKSPNHEELRVLVAEDNPLNQKILRLMFAKFSIPLDLANNGREAVELADKSAYKLILMDLHMPIMNGAEAAIKIREILGETCPPIVALTADAYFEKEMTLSESGLDDFLLKPITSESLRQCVETHTGTVL